MVAKVLLWGSLFVVLGEGKGPGLRGRTVRKGEVAEEVALGDNEECCGFHFKSLAFVAGTLYLHALEGDRPRMFEARSGMIPTRHRS